MNPKEQTLKKRAMDCRLAIHQKYHPKEDKLFLLFQVNTPLKKMLNSVACMDEGTVPVDIGTREGKIQFQRSKIKKPLASMLPSGLEVLFAPELLIEGKVQIEFLNTTQTEYIRTMFRECFRIFIGNCIQLLTPQKMTLRIAIEKEEGED